MSLTAFKFVLALGTLVVGALGAFAPIMKGRGGEAGGLVGASNAFAAGLFLAIGLVHFLPESAEAYAGLGFTYPVASLLVVVTFLVLLLLEHVLVPEAAHEAAHAHSGAGHHGHGHPPNEAASSPYILVAALAVHSFLAGGALGAEVDASGALLTFLAIAVHKGAAGLALGLALVNARLSTARMLWLATLFALMTPLGIGLGTAVGELLRNDQRALFDAAATALAAGTFLYIGTFDLVQDEFLRAGRRWTKWVCAVVGAGLAALLAAWL